MCTLEISQGNLFIPWEMVVHFSRLPVFSRSAQEGGEERHCLSFK